MEQHPFPGPERGDVPLPGGPARGGVPGGPADDWDGEAAMEAFLADIEAGRARVPEPWEIEGPAASISLGDAADVDLAGLAVMAGPAPLPALISLIVPAGTLLGWSAAPGQAGAWGLTDPEDTRAIVQAASRHPRTRWCVTVTGPDGTAVAHGCARGRHPWTPAPASSHPHRQGGGGGSRHAPGRLLAHLIRARTARCSAPGCGAQACFCDLDHSVPYPAGRTCECGLGPVCRRHHRCKQAPGWRLRQPEPGIIRWTTPSGRTYTTTPTVCDW